MQQQSLAQQMQEFLLALQFQQQQAAQQTAQNYGTQYGAAPGGNWMTWGTGGPTQPAAGTPTTAASEAAGSVGYTPGYTGLLDSQTQSLLAQQAATAQGAAGQTGFYQPPAQSQWTPGSFVRIDPNTYDTSQYGTQQLDYVLPSGQLQRVNAAQAQALGWNGNLNAMNTVPLQTALGLEAAAPTQLPQQTLQGQQTYGQLNQAALQNAINTANTTGMFTSPAAIQAPGTDLQGNKFSDLPQATQQAYYASNGGDWNAAMSAWVSASNANITQWAQQNGIPVPGQAGTPQETLAAQNQYFNQAAQLGQLYGQYYAPGAPGQASQTGVNAPQPGQVTEAAREFNATNALQQGQLGQQYLATAAQLQGPQNTFQLSNYLRGAQGNPNVPVYLQNLQNNQGMAAFQAPGTTTPTPQSAAGLTSQMGYGVNGSGTTQYDANGNPLPATGSSSSATPGWNYNATLNSINQIAQQGAQKLGPGSLEQLSPDEYQAFGSGLGAAGYSMPSFLAQYNASRVGQNAPIAATSLTGA